LFWRVCSRSCVYLRRLAARPARLAVPEVFIEATLSRRDRTCRLGLAGL